MPTITPTPSYPAPNYQVSVLVTLTGSGSNYVRIWCTIAPEGSELAKKLAAEGTKDAGLPARVQVYEGTGGPDDRWTWTPDVGGKYTFEAQEIERGSGFRGGYAGDTRGILSETPHAVETLTLFVGQRTTCHVGTGQDVSELVLWVWNSHIRRSYLSMHGEDTPAIKAKSRSDRAISAANATSVQSAVNDLAPDAAITVASAIGGESYMLPQLVAKWNAHLIEGYPSAVHYANDYDNAVPVEYMSAATPQEKHRVINELFRKMRQHFMNDCGGRQSDPPVQAGVGSANYHRVSGEKKADMLNLPLYQGVSGPADSYAAIADLWRCFSGHIASTTVHQVADGMNALALEPPLLAVHRAYLEHIASSAPTAPPAQSTGAQLLISTAGFTEG